MSSVSLDNSLTSSKPYLVRALYEWILDNDLTPYLMVNADVPGAHVPRQYVKDGQIILNISPLSTTHLQITNDRVEFRAAFGGRPFSVLMPVSAVQAIYAKENGQGMFFGEDIPGGGGGGDGLDLQPTEPEASSDEATPAAEDKTKKRPPHLKIVK